MRPAVPLSTIAARIGRGTLGVAALGVAALAALFVHVLLAFAWAR